VGAAAGWFNGFLVTRVGLPSLAVTIGTLTLYRGIAVVVLGPSTISSFPTRYTNAGVTPLPHTGGYLSYSVGVFIVLARVFAGLQNALFLTNFEQRAMGVVTGTLLLLSVLIPNVSAFVERGREFLRRRELGAPARQAAS